MSKTQQASKIIQQEISKQTLGMIWVDHSIKRIERECVVTHTAAKTYFKKACQALILQGETK